MRKLAGIVGVAVASTLIYGAPALGAPDDTTTDTSDPTTTTTVATSEPTSTTTSPSTTTTVAVDIEERDSADTTASGNSATSSTHPAVAPIDANDRTPERGTQVQLVAPPPPPPPPEWVLPANSGQGRRVVYSKSIQRVWAVDGNGVVIKTHKVSGRQTPLDPRPGTYSVWSRSLHTHSLENPTITWKYMVRFAHGARGGNIGLHEIPFQYGRPVQSLSQLGQPLSGGCVRQSTPDAIWMWNWAHLGTKVVVLP